MPDAELCYMAPTPACRYDHQPAPGTPEAELLDACKNPRSWVWGSNRHAGKGLPGPLLS